MPSRLTLVLIASIAANAVLFGIVAGRWLGPAQAHEPTVQMQLEQYGPPSDVVDDAWAQLPEGDKAILKQQLRDSWIAMTEERGHLGEAGQRVYAAALAEPFNEAKLRDAVAIFQLRENRLQQVAEDILISHLSGMPAQARATAAVGLLTPFNARVQRAGQELLAEDQAPSAVLPPGSPVVKPN